MRLIIIILLCLLSYHLNAQVIPISQGHSHNDYERERPLMDALDVGMTSIEVDVILADGKVIVSHDAEKYNIDNTIEKMYLIPMKKLIKKRGGSLYSEKSRRQIQLLIDLKTKGVDILNVLDSILQKYGLLFDKRGLDKRWSPLQIVLSGEIDKKMILGKKKYQYFHVDGRCADLKKKYPTYEMPLISENYTKHFKWIGLTELKMKEKRKLKKLIDKVHSQGKKIRFWATPDDEKVWSYLLDQGVDYINVDDLVKFQNYMSTR
ncbi:MAG: hypothetical protein V3V00_04755 [Saprospiraceae bacterium]